MPVKHTIKKTGIYVKCFAVHCEHLLFVIKNDIGVGETHKSVYLFVIDKIDYCENATFGYRDVYNCVKMLF